MHGGFEFLSQFGVSLRYFLIFMVLWDLFFMIFHEFS